MAKKMNFMVILKALVIVVLTLLMLIPLALVSGSVSGRLQYKNDAISKITNSWGGQILIAAPILNIPYTTAVKDENGKVVDHTKSYAKFAPKNLTADVHIVTQTRTIGIFSVPVYVAEITLTGSFENQKQFADFRIAESFLSLEINDLKGISTPEISWNGQQTSFEPSTKASPLQVTLTSVEEYSPSDSYTRYYDKQDSQMLQSLSAKIPLQDGVNKFTIKFSIKGSQAISFVPLAKDNSFRIRSNWTTPNFSGSFLPDTKTINRTGFDALWNINYLASGIPPRIDGANLSPSVFTTSLLIPIDNYKSAERARKYGILFIVLTFIACFLFEVLSKKSIHPFQYLLVGLAMSLFYLLLLALSEFMPFALAYLIAAVAIILMITLYAKFAIAKTLTFKQTSIIAGAFVILYGYLYVLLQLKDIALLFGAIGLFVALAAMMYATRNINWYK